MTLAATPSPIRPTAATFSFMAGAFVLAALWLGPLPAMSRTAFSPHMLLHLGVVVVAAPLLGFGLAPRLRTPETFGNALGWYLLAAAAEMLVVWAWHIPLLHDAAGRDGLRFVIEQASFLAGGLALWTAVFTARNRAAVAAAAIALFFTFTHMSMFGLLLTLAPKLLYDPDLCRGAFGFDRVDDQHFGGALMVIGAGGPYLVATAVACLKILRETPTVPGSPHG